MKWAIKRGLLVVDPPEEEGYDLKVSPTSIDLRLDDIGQAKVWDVDKLRETDRVRSSTPSEDALLYLGEYEYKALASEYLTDPPKDLKGEQKPKVFKRGDDEILVRSGGFLLWQTKETIGTPAENPMHICFVDGKSTRARTGLLVHLTAPTIHAGWSGNVVLEIANLGPFTFVLREDDVIAQLTVATISSPPEQTQRDAGSSTMGQGRVTGEPGPSAVQGPPDRDQQ